LQNFPIQEPGLSCPSAENVLVTGYKPPCSHTAPLISEPPSGYLCQLKWFFSFSRFFRARSFRRCLGNRFTPP
jgi:hypothetical protein